jgi:hypothetical protein
MTIHSHFISLTVSLNELPVLFSCFLLRPG